MARAWTYQDPKQVEKYGEDAASWYAGWYDPAGKKRCKSCGPGSKGKLQAEKLRDKIQAQLNTGTYDSTTQKTWKDFREEYEAKIAEGMDAANRRLTLEALAAFERIVKPVRMLGITTATIDQFIRARSQEPGKKRGSTVSPATVNKNLRHLRAVMTIAVEWKYLKERPRFRMIKEPRKLVRYVTGEDFALIYAACDDHARKPADLPCTAPDWWKALLIMAYMTGWRISELLALRWEDVDLKAGTALTRAEDNKGGRDDRVRLHPLVVEHLERIASFGSHVFPWNYDRGTLDDEFDRIQNAGGINLPCTRKHQHTDACHTYGFHDLRRAFATVNAPRLTADALQKLMRHKSYLTTQRYINLATQLDEAVDNLHVPDLKPRKKA